MHKIAEPAIYLLASAILAAVAIYALHPGWLYYDSAMQWAIVAKLSDVNWLQHEGALSIIGHWPLFNSIMRVPFLVISNDVALLGWVQATLLFFSVYILARSLLDGVRWQVCATCAMVCLWPNTINVAVSQASDVWVASMYMLLMALYYYRQAVRPSHRWRLLADMLCLMLLVAMLRSNATLTFCMICPLILWQCLPPTRARKWLAALLVISVIGTPVMANGWLDKLTSYSSPGSQGLALRLWIQDFTFYSPSAQPVMQQMVNQGLPSNHGKHVDEDCYISGIWCADYYYSVDHSFITRNPATHKQMAEAYIMSFFDSPYGWVKATLPVFASFTGLSYGLNNGIIGRYDISNEINGLPTNGMKHTAIRDAFQAIDGYLSWYGYGRPLYLLLINIILVAWMSARQLLTHREKHRIYMLFFMTLAYAMPMAMLAPDPQQRYYYPFTLPNLILFWMLVTRLVTALRKPISG